MSTAWFIDALDPDAGIAFASFRSPEITMPSVVVDVPAIHISAPDFSVHQLTGRGLGLAATRGSFQAGLFLEGRELGFALPSDLVEFVRRAYIGRGGGNTTPGAPERPAPFGPSPRVPDGEEFGAGERRLDDLPWRATGDPREDPHGGRGATDLLSGYLEAFVDASQRTDYRSLTKDGVETVIATSVRAESLPAADPTPMLMSGIDEILSELLARGPSPSAPQAMWDLAVDRIGMTCLRLGLDDVFRQIVARLSSIPSSPRAYRGLPAVFGELEDRFDDLARWPVADSVARAVGLPVPFATVKDLLVTAVSAPTRLRALPPDRMPIVVFAAVHLQPFGSPLVSDRASKALNHRELIVEQSWLWLRAQLPHRAFAPEVEALLPPPGEERGSVVMV
ncbi:hypothetical protein [Microbacterium sp. NPDC058389]|uniref:hypothetical protein n=1 Tax=Microbacterium sp. NPDC058389 TaxID=3346475 RepID=UPI0036506D47